MTHKAVSSITEDSGKWVGEIPTAKIGVWLDYAMLLVSFLSNLSPSPNVWPKSVMMAAKKRTPVFSLFRFARPLAFWLFIDLILMLRFSCPDLRWPSMASLLSACVVVQDTRKGSYIVSKRFSGMYDHGCSCSTHWSHRFFNRWSDDVYFSLTVK